MAKIPAYMRIREYVVSQVMANPGREVQVAPERELCSIFNVTRNTVRRALKDLAEDDYLIVRHGRGTFTNPRRFTPYPDKTKKIGVMLFDGKSFLYDAYCLRIINGISETIIANRGFLQFAYSAGGIEESVKEIAGQKFDGIIMISPNDNLVDLALELQRNNIPVVGVYRDMGPTIPNIRSDYYQLGYLAAKALIENGHERFVFLYSSVEHSKVRFEGVMDAFKELEKEFDPELCIEFPSNELKIFQNKLNDLLDRGVDFSAVYDSGENLYAVEEVLNERNLLDQYLMVGLDSRVSLSDSPSKISISYPLEEMGRKGCEFLYKLINGEEPDNYDYCIAPHISIWQ